MLPAVWALGVACVLAVSAAQVDTSTAATESPGLRDAERSVDVAQAAFEYRDFEQVLTLLDPWVHPPRIADPRLMVQARELLAVSRHVLGDERGAREEMAQLLLIAPEHELDPFRVPPQVIATFEDVRQALGPRLGAGSPDPEPDPSPTTVRIVEVPHPVLGLVPLGVPQLALGDAPAGALFGGAQVVGLILNIAAYAVADGLPANERDPWLALQYGGLGLAAAGYFGSVVHAELLIEEQRRALAIPGATF